MRIDRRDVQFLMTIADYRVQTIKQITALEKRNAKSTQQRVSRLAEGELILKTDRLVSAKPGRREALVSIAPRGFEVLRAAGVLRPDVIEQAVTLAGLPHIEHQLLLNWVRIQWLRINGLHPALLVRFVAHSSPVVHQDESDAADEHPEVGVIRVDGVDAFTPDAVATISDLERHKTVLFFLEVDMGTEPWDSPQKNRSTIAQKIKKYQRYFHSERYRDYESVWRCLLRGFRVLFVSSTKARSYALGRHLVSIRPREFIWVTDQDQLLERGVGAPIWARGGQQDRPRESILGSRARRDPPATTGISPAPQVP